MGAKDADYSGRGGKSHGGGDGGREKPVLCHCHDEKTSSCSVVLPAAWFFLPRGSAASHACVHRDGEGLFDSTPSALCHLGTGGKLMKTNPVHRRAHDSFTGHPVHQPLKTQKISVCHFLETSSFSSYGHIGHQPRRSQHSFGRKKKSLWP